MVVRHSVATKKYFHSLRSSVIQLKDHIKDHLNDHIIFPDFKCKSYKGFSFE